MKIPNLSKLTKRQAFIAILVFLGLLSVIFSVITRFTFIMDRPEEALRIAVVGPMSGPNAAAGNSIRQGAELYAQTFNDAGGIGGNKIAIEVFDDKDDPEEAAKVATAIAAKTDVVAVIGHLSDAVIAKAGPIYAARKVPLIAPTAVGPKTLKANEWLFSVVFNDERQAMFLANYTRNVLGHRLVSIIQNKPAYGATLAEPFAETYKRFGTAIRYTFDIDPAQASVQSQMRKIADDLRTKQDAGVIFLAMDGIESARMLAMLRDSGVRNPVVGTDKLATHAFINEIVRVAEKPNDLAKYTDGILATTPLLFDTANEVAQGFRSRYLAANKTHPDWLAAYSYDAVHIALATLKKIVGGKNDANAQIAAKRRALRNDLAAIMTPEQSVMGISGQLFFNRDREGQSPILIGIYNGKNMISALTQLQRIKGTGAANYIEELKRGRVLYVNDRFMYKTNVVYTGLQVKEITDINLEKNTAVIDFVIWFRFRGNFRPEDLVFTNAAELIPLDEPEDEMKVGDMTYRLYRVKGLFNMNFAKTLRPYGSQLVGITFSHRTLSHNNLLYVVDVLGLGLESGQTLLDKLKAGQVLGPRSGWDLARAWLSQDVVEKSTLGNPSYVGYGSVDPDFSKIDLGAIIRKDEIAVRDFVPSEYFIYLGIFGVLGVVFSILMDRKERGRFWSVQSWGLRVVAWPVLLLAAGNLLLDLAFQRLPTSYIDLIVMVYSILWWLVPARLLGMAVERFIWQPLEDHTERNIPNVVRVFVSVAIYSFASFGVIAFVFDQKITSLLATSGLLAMIVGLAVQANISNIFSGIVINMERPFSVGDWVKIGGMDEGRVIDITWRTTRVKTRNGYVISVPNSKASEAEIHNYDSFDVVRLELPFYLDARFPIEDVAQWMSDGLNKAPNVLETPEREIRFKSIEFTFGLWIAKYEIQFWIDNYGRREEIEEKVLACVWHELRNHGVSTGANGRGNWLASRMGDEGAGLEGEGATAQIEGGVGATRGG